MNEDQTRPTRQIRRKSFGTTFQIGRETISVPRRPLLLDATELAAFNQAEQKNLERKSTPIRVFTIEV